MPFSLPLYLRYRWKTKNVARFLKKEKRKRDCPCEQSLKRKRETKIVLDKS